MPILASQELRGICTICETVKVRIPAQKRNQGVVNLRRKATARKTGTNIISKMENV
jgi:hypothetical protein